MSGVVIRPARAGEGETLGALGFAAWAGSQFGVHDNGRVDRAALLAEFVAFGVEQSQTIVVAEAYGVVAGWGAREHGDHRISDLWVAPDFQGRGIGGALLQALVAQVAGQGYPVAELETLAENSLAIRFYEKHDFVVVWRGEKFSTSLGYAIDKVRLNKSLSL